MMFLPLNVSVLPLIGFIKRFVVGGQLSISEVWRNNIRRSGLLRYIKSEGPEGVPSR